MMKRKKKIMKKREKKKEEKKTKSELAKEKKRIEGLTRLTLASHISMEKIMLRPT